MTTSDDIALVSLAISFVALVVSVLGIQWVRTQELTVELRVAVVHKLISDIAEVRRRAAETASVALGAIPALVKSKSIGPWARLPHLANDLDAAVLRLVEDDIILEWYFPGKQLEAEMRVLITHTDRISNNARAVFAVLKADAGKAEELANEAMREVSKVRAAASIVAHRALTLRPRGWWSRGIGPDVSEGPTHPPPAQPPVGP